MMQGFGRQTSGLLLAVSVVIGLAWWVLVWQKGLVGALPSALAPFLVAFGVLQVVGWLLMVPLVRGARNSVPEAGQSAPLVLGAVLILGNALFYFTPVVGAPIIAVAAVAEAGLVARRRAVRAG